MKYIGMRPQFRKAVALIKVNHPGKFLQQIYGVRKQRVELIVNNLRLCSC